MRQALYILDQVSDNNPSVRYCDNQLGFNPTITRNTDGLCTINLSQAFPECEERLFCIAPPVLKYQNGVENPELIQTTQSFVNHVDGEIIIENRINGNLSDDFQGFQLHIMIKD